MNEKVRLVSLLSMGLVVAAFARSRSKGELALGLISLMLVAVVYFDQRRPSTIPHASLAPPVEPLGSFADIHNASSAQTDEATPVETTPGDATVPAVMFIGDTDASSHADVSGHEHPGDVLEKRQAMLQDYMMQPSVTRKPTSAALNAYIMSIARQHRVENSADPSLKPA